MEADVADSQAAPASPGKYILTKELAATAHQPQFAPLSRDQRVIGTIRTTIRSGSHRRSTVAAPVMVGGRQPGIPQLRWLG